MSAGAAAQAAQAGQPCGTCCHCLACQWQVMFGAVTVLGASVGPFSAVWRGTGPGFLLCGPVGPGVPLGVSQAVRLEVLPAQRVVEKKKVVIITPNLSLWLSHVTEAHVINPPLIHISKRRCMVWEIFFRYVHNEN